MIYSKNCSWTNGPIRSRIVFDRENSISIFSNRYDEPSIMKLSFLTPQHHISNFRSEMTFFEIEEVNFFPQKISFPKKEKN